MLLECFIEVVLLNLHKTSLDIKGNYILLMNTIVVFAVDSSNFSMTSALFQWLLFI